MKANIKVLHAHIYHSADIAHEIAQICAQCLPIIHFAVYFLHSRLTMYVRTSTLLSYMQQWRIQGRGEGEGSIRYRLQAHSKLLKSGQANECGLAISMRPGILWNFAALRLILVAFGTLVANPNHKFEEIMCLALP